MKTMHDNNTLLQSIQQPSDIRQWSPEQLLKLSDAIREFMVETLNQSGGHFAANLGVVELTIALHYVFQTPYDRLIWDVGHQSYPHKILTGRANQLHTIKQLNGLAPFPKRHESPYDTFGVGHSSTSISAGLGMSIAHQFQQQHRQTVAIIGDGGLTGGMAFEALNHAGTLDPNFLIILNDNDMSISENVGALTHYFGRILSGKVYGRFRAGGKKVLAQLPQLSKLAKRTETQVKHMIQPGALFEELGINYFGPTDGHDLETLIATLRNINKTPGVKILHVITQKGKGYPPAEADPIGYHAVTPGFKDKTESNNQKKLPTYSQVFGTWLCQQAERDKKCVAITPAMREGSGLVEFSQRFPKQYFDVSIAEQHAVTFAAGLACEGLKPVVAIYSTFLQRAYDQLIHDVAIQNLDVTFAIDRAGLVGGDDPTHSGSFDLGFLRMIPNLVIMAASDETTFYQMLNTAYQYEGPACVRYPRGTGPGLDVQPNTATIELGRSRTIQSGGDIAILSFGSMLTTAKAVADQLNATLIDMQFIKPIDKTAILQAAEQHQLIVTLEENAQQGGAGSAVLEVLGTAGQSIPTLTLGIPDQFIDHGNKDTLMAQIGLSEKGIIKAIQDKLTQLN